MQKQYRILNTQTNEDKIYDIDLNYLQEGQTELELLHLYVLGDDSFGVEACNNYVVIPIDGLDYVYQDGEAIKLIDTPEYILEQTEKREEQFIKEFFSTSLGYVRRKVFVQGTGETKDFLSDCLSVLCNAFSLGQNIQAIVYNKPPMTEDVSDWTEYQKTIDWSDRAVQQAFLGECLLQYQKDFFCL